MTIWMWMRAPIHQLLCDAKNKLKRKQNKWNRCTVGRFVRLMCSAFVRICGGCVPPVLFAFDARVRLVRRWRACVRVLQATQSINNKQIQFKFGIWMFTFDAIRANLVSFDFICVCIGVATSTSIHFNGQTSASKSFSNWYLPRKCCAMPSIAFPNRAHVLWPPPQLWCVFVVSR